MDNIQKFSVKKASQGEGSVVSSHKNRYHWFLLLAVVAIGAIAVWQAGFNGDVFSTHAQVSSSCTGDCAPMNPAPAGRYIDPIFSSSSSTVDILYHDTFEDCSNSSSRCMDVYEPAGDTLARRPAVVWVHGGGFTGGDKGVAGSNHANDFVQAGYVFASINYRLSSQQNEQAVINAQCDLASAIRFLREDAATVNLYRIDPDKIIVAGTSAGAITSLYGAYNEDQGDCLNNNPSNPGYSSRPQAAVSFAGGIQDPAMVAAGDPPAILFHNDGDPTVSYSTAQNAEAGAITAGVPYEFHTFVGDSDHVDFFDSADKSAFVKLEMKEFLYRYVTGTGPFAPVANAGQDQTATDGDGTGAEMVVLDGTGSSDADGTIVSYAWSEAGNPLAQGITAQVAFSVGAHTVNLLVTDNDGATSTDSVLITVQPGNPPPVLYFSLGSNGTVGGVSAANEDIIAFDGSNFSQYFDGSDVGVGSLTLDAFSVVSANEILMSFADPATIPGVSGTVDDSDVVRFSATSLGDATAGSFSLYFDGSDVGLTTSDEDVDAVELLADGRIVVSTTGNISVTGASGADEDLVAFTPSSLGSSTAGSWALYFDGSDVGLADSSSEDVDATAVSASGAIYLSTTGNFSVTGVSGADEDVFTFTPTSLGATTVGSYASTLFFDGSQWGLSGNDLFAIDVP